MIQTKYLSPFTDYGFKKVFGEDGAKGSLISFLNDALPIEYKIKSLKFLPNEQLGNDIEARNAIYDIFCEDENGGQFIVEMQNARQLYFKDRTVFYSTFPIQRQAKKGKWNFKLKNVYCVSLLGFEMPGETDEYHHVVQLKNQNNEVFYDKLTYIYFELPKFDLKLEELSTHLEKWLYFLKHLDEFEKLPEILGEQVFFDTLERIEYTSLPHLEQMKYDTSLKVFRDNINVIETARMEGREEGFEKGVEKGIQKGALKTAIENATRMLEKGFDWVMVTEITGMTESEYNKYLKSDHL